MFSMKSIYSPVAQKPERQVLSQLHVRTADFPSVPEEVLSGKKHGFASRGDTDTQGDEEQTTQGQTPPDSHPELERSFRQT